MFNLMSLVSNLIALQATFAIIGPIIIFIDLVVIFLTIFLIIKLKNNLGVYICWIPSFISFLVMFIFLFWDISTALFVLLVFFLPHFISYALTTIIKIRNSKLKADKNRREKEESDKTQEELNKISIQDL